MEEQQNPRKFKILSVVLFIFLIIAVSAVVFLYKNQPIHYTIKLPFTPEGFDLEFSYGAQKSLENHDFFDKVKNQFVTEKADFIEADLSRMILRVYKEGEMNYEVPILTKGREGSWWETPAGLYKINTKTDNHFSSIGRVWMPWAMQFQGNFFIHGETYYNDGTPTSSQYSGGCIRLKTEDAEKIYELVSIGTPLLVFEESFNSDNFIYNNKKRFEIDSPSYLVADLMNNHIFAQESSTQAFEIGPITKLMTALVATEYINLDKYATVPKTALIDTEKPRFGEGFQYTIYQLLFPLLLEDSNEAAETIARNYGREIFIKQMNAKAKSIGMTNTVFVDPTGNAPENVSTAEDLFMLAKYINNNRSFIFDITSENVNTRIYGQSGFGDLENFNAFKDHEYFYGGQSGMTVLKVPVENTFRPITFITLGTASTTEAGTVLINDILESFK